MKSFLMPLPSDVLTTDSFSPLTMNRLQVTASEKQPTKISSPAPSTTYTSCPLSHYRQRYDSHHDRHSKSGVDARILMPAIPDKPLVGILNRSYYQVLLKGGVRIFEYTPGFVHAKQFVSDDKIALVGTINLDYRSLVHHFENGVWMYDTSSVLPIRDDFLSTLEQSEEITLESLRRRGLLYHVLLSILRLFAPLM